MDQIVGKRKISFLNTGDTFAHLLISADPTLSLPQSIIKLSLNTSNNDKSSFVTTANKYRRLVNEGKTKDIDESQLTDKLSVIAIRQTHTNNEYSNYIGKNTYLSSPAFLLQALLETVLPANLSSLLYTPTNSAVNMLESITPCYNVEIITGPSEKQIDRCIPSVPSIFRETAEVYERFTLPFIEAQATDKSLQWVYNCVDKVKEVERILYDDSQFILNVDTKWRNHCDCKLPTDEWREHVNTNLNDLYCLAIIKERGIRTIRDLRGAHIGLLRSIKLNGLKAIEERYGILPNNVRVFVHYIPQFYHFHVHFTRLWNEGGVQCERAHLLDDIVDNLELDGEWYVKRALTFKLGSKDGLCKVVKEGIGIVEEEQKAKLLEPEDEKDEKENEEKEE